MATLCEVCGIGEMTSEGGSMLFCMNCGSQSTTYVDEALDAENVHMYNPVHRREKTVRHDADLDASQPTSIFNSQSQSDFVDGTGSDQLRTIGAPLPASHFGQNFYPRGRIPDGQLAAFVRSNYVGGLQKMVQLQCEALVKEFGVNPLICGVVGPVWLKYVASTRVFEAAWADEALEVAEHREQGRKGNRSRESQDEKRPEALEAEPQPQPQPEPEPELKPTPGDLDLSDPKLMRGSLQRKKRKKRDPDAPRRKNPLEPRTAHGRQLRFVWLNALKERIPLSITLAVCFLACYIVREPILPTDIMKWASEGRLPYLSAFVQISKPASHHTPNSSEGERVFPIDPRHMFRPTFLLGSRRLELLAGFIADRISLRIPPINFHAVGAKLLKEMELSRTHTLDYAQRLHSWYTPSGLWISGDKKALPTRVYVVAMLVIAMKVICKLDGRDYQQANGESERNVAQGVATSSERKKVIDLQPSHNMVTRRARKAAEHQRKEEAKEVGPTEMTDRTRTDASMLGSDAESSQAAMARGERGPSPSARSRDGEEQKKGGESAKMGSVFLERKATRQPDQCKVGDAKELIRIMEGRKTEDTMGDDEKLLKYLQYCQNVVFAKLNRVDEVQRGVDLMWNLYKSREEVTKTEEPERVRVEEGAGPSSPRRFGVARPFASDEQQDTSKEESGSGSAARGSMGASGSGSGPGPRLPRIDLSTLASSQPGGAELEKTTPPEGPKSNSNNANDGPKSNSNNSNDGDKHSGEDPQFGAGLANDVDARSRSCKSELAILIDDMKDAGFEYLPPLSRPVDAGIYMRYKIPTSPSGLTAVHGDYFQVLRAFGKAIDVHPKAIHRCVTIIERGLLKVESKVGRFLLLQQAFELPEDIKRRNPPRPRDKKAERDRNLAAARNVEHLTDLSYI